MFRYHRIVVLGAVLGLVGASPVPSEKRAISSELLGRLSFFEQYAAAAYCTGNNTPNSTAAITCSAGNCPLVEADQAKTVAEFQHQGTFDTTGYVAVDPAKSLIVVAFRGSESAENWIEDFDFLLVPWTKCKGCFVHTGFLSGWNSVKPTVQSAVARANAQYPSYELVVTGHSLGAALATVAAADLRVSGNTLSLYNYGSPMVGNIPFATFVTGQSSANYRVTHTQDAVPKVPGYALGYAHVSPEYWITAPTSQSVTEQDIKVSSGVVDLKGNQGTLGISFADHVWYFNAVSSCK